MKVSRNFLASVCLAAALAGVAVITAAVGQTTRASMARTDASARTVPLAQVSNPQRLVSADVLDPASMLIGRVARVKTGPTGKPLQVKVALLTPAGRFASFRADTLTFIPSEGVLVAKISRAAVLQLVMTTPGGFAGPGGGGPQPAHPGLPPTSY